VNHPEGLTYLYQKLNIIAISRWSRVRRQKAESSKQQAGEAKYKAVSSDQNGEGNRQKAQARQKKKKVGGLQ